MKKTILSLALLVLSICAYFFFKQYKSSVEDVIPPVLTCETDTITASVEVTDEELLKGVTAIDAVSGDVSDTLVIESLSNFAGDNQRIVTYVAVDENLNVGKLERTLIYTDYEAPTFSLTKPLSFVVGSKVDILGYVRASSTLDGDITNKIRYGLEAIIDNLTPGQYPVEFRITDSCGKTSYLNTQIEVYDSSYAGIDVTLKKYLIYLPKGSKFNAESYFKGSTIEGELSIVSDVNTKKEGTYYVDYLVHGINASGKSRLTVVVY